jgi:hypothetical protein
MPSVESSGLLEHFQWLAEEQSRNLPYGTRAKVAEEPADVLLYLLQPTSSVSTRSMPPGRRCSSMR